MTSNTSTRHGVDEDARSTAVPDPSSWAGRLQRFGHVARPRTDTRERLVPPFPQPAPRLRALMGRGPWPADRVAGVMGWLGPILVAVFAGALRFWRLGSPRAVVFDETYYAKDAWSMLRLGYEGTWPDRKVADPEILAHPQVIPLSDTGSFVAHPPTGKWVISVGGCATKEPVSESGIT